jgi:hypothetical protein
MKNNRTLTAKPFTWGYDWQGNRLSSTNGATGAVYAPNALN